MSMPPPPQSRVTMQPDGPDEMAPDDVSAILRRELHPSHYNDPFVMHFLQCYLACLDVKQAAREANMDLRSAKNLRNRRDIATAIQKVTQVSALKDGYDASEVVARVREWLDVDPLELFDENGACQTDMKRIPPEMRRAIKKFKVKNLYDDDPNGMKTKIGEMVEVEFYSKEKAAEMLGAEKGKFKRTTVVEHDVSSNMKDVLLASTKRAEERSRQVQEAHEKPAVIDVTRKEIADE